MSFSPVFLLSLLVIQCIVANCCLEVERDALIEFKAGMKDPGNRLASWKGLNCCRWVGIECSNHTGHVIKLNLTNTDFEGNNSLSGEISPSLLVLIELKYLDLSNNDFSGKKFPKFICSFRNLEYLDLSFTYLSGIIPPQISNMSKLQTLFLGSDDSADLSINSMWYLSHLTSLIDLGLSGVNIEDSREWVQALNMLTKLESLLLANTSLIGNLSGWTNNWIPSFQLSRLYLTNCKLGPKFPSWLRNQTRLEYINLSNTSIVDNLPDWFRNLTSLRSMDLSNNQIFGNLPSLENFSQLQIITLRDNQFHGAIPSLSHSLITLDLSYNSFTGPLPSKFNTPFLDHLFLSNNLISSILGQYTCGFIRLQILDLSSNNIYGDLPHCWPNTLQAVNLANNNISGVIPSSMSNLSMLISLQLNNNNLIGGFPSSLRLCKNLSIIDLGENQLYGRIPKWLGEMTNLYVLRLRANLFFGDIPTQLVHLPNIQVLDLGDNNISGLIPLRMDKMLAMTSPNKNLETNSTYANFEQYYNNYYNVSLSLCMKGTMLVYSTTLNFLKSIDLSVNNLTGEIPRSIFALVGLINLNLSNNNLNGTIPMEIGNMRLLESLDLKTNELSGIIPRSLSNLNFLAKLNLSYNKLSGEIPTGNQLQILLDPSIYIGNAYLCGSLLNKSCNAEQTLPNDIMQNDNDHLDEILLYLFTVIGLGFGFWLFLGVLTFKQTLRYRFFRKVDNIFDVIYLFVMIHVAKLMKYLIK